MADKIILKFKTKNILNFYEIEPRTANKIDVPWEIGIRCDYLL